jgi:hypothetical protein
MVCPSPRPTARFLVHVHFWIRLLRHHPSTGPCFFTRLWHVPIQVFSRLNVQLVIDFILPSSNLKPFYGNGGWHGLIKVRNFDRMIDKLLLDFSNLKRSTSSSGFLSVRGAVSGCRHVHSVCNGGAQCLSPRMA